MHYPKVDPIEQVIIDRIFSEEITLKEYLDTIGTLEDRINYIASYIGKVIGYEVNYITLENGYREFFGFFNPRECNETIALKVYKERGGNDDVYLYEDGFPTRFLHEEFEDEVDAEYKKYMLEFPD